MTRREVRDQLEEYLSRASRAAAEALVTYLNSPRKVEAARSLGPKLRQAYSALELAESYRQLAALEVATEPAAAKVPR